MKKIKLHSKKYPNKYALVDDEDFKKLNKYKWRILETRNVLYATRNEYKNGKSRKIMMHRQIMNTPKGFETDHINHKTLDNQKKNLRVVTRAQNQQNRIKKEKASSKYKGVDLDLRNNKWRPRIKTIYDYKHLGYYKNEKIAARIYDYKARELFGEYAYLNLPDELLTEKEFNKLYSRKIETSRYTGVYWKKSNRRWASQITINKKRIHLGYFKDEIIAIKTRDKYIINNNLANKYKLNFKE